MFTFRGQDESGLLALLKVMFPRATIRKVYINWPIEHDVLTSLIGELGPVLTLFKESAREVEVYPTMFIIYGSEPYMFQVGKDFVRYYRTVGKFKSGSIINAPREDLPKLLQWIRDNIVRYMGRKLREEFNKFTNTAIVIAKHVPENMITELIFGGPARFLIELRPKPDRYLLAEPEELQAVLGRIGVERSIGIMQVGAKLRDVVKTLSTFIDRCRLDKLGLKGGVAIAELEKSGASIHALYPRENVDMYIGVPPGGEGGALDITVSSKDILAPMRSSEIAVEERFRVERNKTPITMRVEVFTKRSYDEMFHVRDMLQNIFERLGLADELKRVLSKLTFTTRPR